MGTLDVEIGTVESLFYTADPSSAATEGRNSIVITSFSASFREDQVLVANLVHPLIHDNTDIYYQMLVIPREHLCKGPVK